MSLVLPSAAICAVVLSVLGSFIRAQDAYEPIPQPGQYAARQGILGQVGWTTIACPVQAPIGVYADPSTQSVAVWSTQQLAISRDGGLTFSPALGMGPLRGIAEVALLHGHQVVRTTEGQVLLDGGLDLCRRAGVGPATKIAVGQGGSLYLSDSVSTAWVDLTGARPPIKVQGDLSLVIGDDAYAFTGNSAVRVGPGGAGPVSVRGPRPQGWPVRTGPAVGVAYDQAGCRYEVRHGEVSCTSQIGRTVLVQAGPATKNGYYHLAVSGGSGLEISSYCPRTGDAGPTRANDGMCSMSSVASLGSDPRQPLHYILVGIGQGGVQRYFSR